MSRIDVDDMEEAIEGLPITVQRLTATDGAVAVNATTLGDLTLLAGEFGFPIATEGEIAVDSLVVTLQLEEGAGRWNGQDFGRDRAWIYRPGSEHSGAAWTGTADRPPRFATISMSPAVSEWSSAARTAELVEDVGVRALRRIVLDVVNANDSERFTDGHARAAEREIMATVRALEAGATDTRIDRSSAAWITQECIALADSVEPMPSTMDLAAAVGVSDRWVRAAFRKTYGVSASAFFRARAMDGARRELRSACPASVSVTEVALKWGFWHLGRFSATYRSYFGELPSETLACTGC